MTFVLISCGGSADSPPDLSGGGGDSPILQPTASIPQVTATADPEVTAPAPAIPEQRYLTLEFPPQIRAGDSDVLFLTLEVDDKGNIVPTAQIEGNVVSGEVVEIPNLYESHHVFAEARFEIAGVDVSPEELVSQSLAKGQSVSFRWSIRPEEVGKYRGTIWLYLRFVEKNGGEESRITVSAQIVDIEAVNFFGMSANFARTTGLVGSVIGSVIGLPFLEDIVKFIMSRRKKRKN